MQFWKTTYQRHKKMFSKCFEKNDTYIPFMTQILGTIIIYLIINTILITRKVKKYFKNSWPPKKYLKNWFKSLILNQFWNLRHESVGQNFIWHYSGFVKNREIFQNILPSKNAWKTNLNGLPTLVFQFKTRISVLKILPDSILF